MNYELLKEIAVTNNDSELFKIACDLEKDAGWLNTGGQQVVDYLHKKNWNRLATTLKQDVVDAPGTGKAMFGDWLKNRNKGTLVSNLNNPAAKAAQAVKPTLQTVKPKMYQWKDHVVDQAAYDRMGENARRYFKETV